MSVHLGDCLEYMRGLDDDSVDAAVLDPPYGLGKPPPIEVVLRAWLDDLDVEVRGGGFMGREWDAFVPHPRFWRELFRVLKPGAHAVVFSGGRTADVMGIGLRMGGFEIRELHGWAYWSGFPKSLDVGKSLDGGAWNGWGTATKPAIEPYWLVRKPIREGSIARQVLATGTGGLNIDGCRYPVGDPAWPGTTGGGHGGRQGDGPGNGGTMSGGWREGYATTAHPAGRFPANIYACAKASRAERERGLTAADVLCLCTESEVRAWESEARSPVTQAGEDTQPQPDTTGSDTTAGCGLPTDSSGNRSGGQSPTGCRSTTSTTTSKTTASRTCNSLTPRHTSDSTVVASCDPASGTSPVQSAAPSSPSGTLTGTSPGKGGPSTGAVDPVTSDVWSRTSESAEHGASCKRCRRRRTSAGADVLGRAAGSAGLNSPRAGAGRKSGFILNHHNTVKPVRLMRWLVRLVTPPGGTVIDPFTGSGTTGIAAALEGFDFIGAEMDEGHHRIASARIAHAVAHPERWADTEPGMSPEDSARARSASDEIAELERLGQSRLW